MPSFKRFTLSALLVATLAAGTAVSAASLPDLLRAPQGVGTLPVFQPGALLYPVQIDQQALAQLPERGEANLQLPGLSSYRVVIDHVMVHDDGAKTWSGHLKGFKERFPIVLHVGNGGAVGELATPRGYFRLGHVNGKVWLMAAPAVAKDMPQLLSANPRGRAAIIRR